MEIVCLRHDTENVSVKNGYFIVGLFVQKIIILITSVIMQMVLPNKKKSVLNK